LDGDPTPQEHVEGRSSGSLVSGHCAGIYAIGHVTAPQQEGVASDEWMKPGERGRRCHLCPLSQNHASNHPILKADLLLVEGFEKARIIRQPMAANPMN
jgi:hypothetical protein